MTLSKEFKRGQLDDVRLPPTLFASLIGDLAEGLLDMGRIRWPSPVYRKRYRAFADEILGLELWSAQRDVLQACEENLRVAVGSGHKIGKSAIATVIALCDYTAYDDARVILTSTTANQVDRILWRQMAQLKVKAGLCLLCSKESAARELRGERPLQKPCEHSARIDGEMALLARTGLRSGFREVYGFSAKEAEAVAGISGPNMTFIVDEASGVPLQIFEAIEGNRAGGASLFMFSNCTRNEGYFYDAFHSKASFWKTFNISSETTPNVIEGRTVIAGLAERDYIEEKKAEWGEDSAQYIIRIKGGFAKEEEGRIFSIDAIAKAEARWYETDGDPGDGRLFLGLDCAGASGTGDDTAIAVRRAAKILELERARGLTEAAHVVRVLAMLDKYERGRRFAKPPVIVVDAEGPIGSKVARLFRDHLERPGHEDDFVLVSLRASDGAVRQPLIYDRMRDELAANLEKWMRAGGALPEDSKLARELHVLSWRQAADGKYKLIAKRDIKKAIGRSPDTYDAVSLACWEPVYLREGAPGPQTSAGQAAPAEQPPEPVEDYIPAIDPFAGVDAWR